MEFSLKTKINKRIKMITSNFPEIPTDPGIQVVKTLTICVKCLRANINGVKQKVKTRGLHQPIIWTECDKSGSSTSESCKTIAK